MIQDIIDFFSGGFLDIVVRFFTNLGSLFYNNILQSILGLLPDITPVYTILYKFFNFITPFFVFVKDATFLNDFTFALLIGAIIFKISGTYVVYLVKLTLKWYHQLMP